MVKELTLNKVAAALVGVAMVAGLAFAFTASRAHAVTLSELVELFIALDVIPADKAAEARSVLASQGSESTSAGASVSCNFTRNLKTGDTGADVKDLQKLLNAKGFTVSASGAGSVGMETEYFGPATKAAVAKMQEAFAADILTPLGLTTGTGFFGASTRAKANGLCSTATTPTTPTEPGEGTTTNNDEETTSSDLSGGEASLDSFKRLGSPSNEEVGEGDEDVQVAGWSFDVNDADAAIKRVDVRFEATAGDSGYSKKPYEYFKEIKLMLGDEEIASVDANSKSDWDDLAGNAYGIKFTGLNEKVSADETAKLYVAVTMADNLDSTDENTTWNVWVADRGIRARDGEGLDQYVGDKDLLTDADYERTFSTVGATQNDEFKVSLASSNPAASTIKVDDTSATNDVAILVFSMKAKGNDMTLDGDFPVSITVAGAAADFSKIVSDVKLSIDGTEYTDWTSVATTSSTTIVTFDLSDEDVAIAEDETVEAKVIVDLNKLNNNYANGYSVKASVTGDNVDNIDVEGGDTLTGSDKTGSATGEVQTLMSNGIYAEIVTITETKTAGDNNANDVGDYVFKFDVTAFEDNFYVGSTSASVAYHIEKSGVTQSVGTSSASLTSTASKESGNYRVDDGDTKTFTFSVSVNPSAGEGSGYYRVVIDSINYGTSATGPFSDSYTVSPAEDFESDELNLNA